MMRKVLANCSRAHQLLSSLRREPSPLSFFFTAIAALPPLAAELLQGIHRFDCMEVVLKKEDAVDWNYRGEGAANIVLGYTGSSPAFVGKVIRVPKAALDSSQNTSVTSDLTMYENVLWHDTIGLVSCTPKEIVEQLFVLNVMIPFLGSEHVDAGILVHVSTEFLEAVEKNIRCQRPAWRVDAAQVNILCDSALLISDHSVFAQGFSKEHPCVSVEIKPKCGFLPSSRFIAEGNAVKKSITRFQMHQVLKLHQGKISQVSEYDPLDLFSGSIERINKAVKSLFTSPQNNFRIFVNGSLIFGGLGGSTNDLNSMVNEAFENKLGDVIQADHGLRLARFLHLVAETIFRSGVLTQLLEAQKLDSLDIEGAIHAYYNILSKPCKVCQALGDDNLAQNYLPLHSISLEESLNIVKDYLIAATAKDCSLMISFRPRNIGDPPSPNGTVYLKPTDQIFDYKAHFIDLDLKPLNKFVHYYELDKKIVSCYMEMEKMRHQPSETAKEGHLTARMQPN